MNFSQKLVAFTFVLVCMASYSYAGNNKDTNFTPQEKAALAKVKNSHYFEFLF